SNQNRTNRKRIKFSTIRIAHRSVVKKSIRRKTRAKHAGRSFVFVLYLTNKQIGRSRFFYLAIFLLKRDLSRLALFLWIRLFDSAISIALAASLYNASTLSAPEATASSNFLIAVRIALV